MNQSKWTNTFLFLLLCLGMSNYREICASFINPRCLLAGVLITSLVSQPSGAIQLRHNTYWLSAKQEKETLLQSALKGNKEAENRYKTLLRTRCRAMRQCRSPTCLKRGNLAACTHVTFSLGSWTTSWIASSTGAIIKFISRFLRRSSVFASANPLYGLLCWVPGAKTLIC